MEMRGDKANKLAEFEASLKDVTDLAVREVGMKKSY